MWRGKFPRILQGVRLELRAIVFPLVALTAEK